jgi:Bacteriodetes cell division protein (FtsL-like)
MSENTFKLKSNEQKSIFRRIENLLNMNGVFEDGLPVKYVPHVLFITILGVFYVGNTHYGETTQRKINHVQVEVEDLRADYTTLKADYMYARLQSEVAKRLEKNGIVESEDPPVKIVITKK